MLSNTLYVRTAALALSFALTGNLVAQTWTRQYPNTFPDLLDVATDGAANVLAVGNEGVVLRSTDAGLTWTRHDAPAGRLAAVAFLGGVVLAGGDGLYRSTDGGVTFMSVHPYQGIQAIEPVGASEAWAVTSDGFVLHSTDTGASWSLAPLPAGWFFAAHDVTFENALSGWIVGFGGQLLRTTDGGQTWLTTPSPTNWTLFGAQRDSGSVKFLLEDSGVYRGGINNWSYSLFPWVTNARDFEVRGNFGLAVGLSGRIMLSPNNGVNWIFAFDDGGVEHEGVVILDASVALVVGEDGRILRTSDSGVSWSVVHGAPPTASPWVRGLGASDQDTLFAACTSGKVLRTDDAGATWVEQQAGSPQTHLRAVDSFDGTNLYAVGERQGFYPTFCYSNDGGLNWNELNQLGMYDIWDVEAIDHSIAVAASDTRIWRTVNGGATWTSVAPLPFTDFHSIAFATQTSGWAVGTAIFRTDDAGVTWTFQADAPVPLWGVSFGDIDHGWAVGEGGTILRTVDGGVNWAPQTAGTTNSLLTVTALTADTALAAGVNGTVLITTDGGATWTPSVPAGLSTDPINASVQTSNGVWIGGDADAGIWRFASGNAGCVVQSYCAGKVHSLGYAAYMALFGVPSVSLPLVSVGVRDAIPNTIGVGFRSVVGPAAQPLLGGTLCVQGPLTRLPIVSFDGYGFAYYSVPMDPSMIGDSHWYQVMYRDVNASDGTGFGITDGIRVTFCP